MWNGITGDQSRLDPVISPADRSWGIGPLCLRRTASAAKGRDGHSRTAWPGRTRRTTRSRWAGAGPIRFVDGECRQACTLACQDNERILSTYAINPGGSFVFNSEYKGYL